MNKFIKDQSPNILSLYRTDSFAAVITDEGRFKLLISVGA
jgi:hypothetical protein